VGVGHGAPTLFVIPVLRYMICPVGPPEGEDPRASDEAQEPWVPASAGTTK
jgi:hypothetical protein